MIGFAVTRWVAAQCYGAANATGGATWTLKPMQKKDSGIDWPIRYKDLAPWYDYVEQFVGISGS